MRIVLLLITSFCIAGFVRSHAYYFGFAELAFNADSKRLEATLVLSAHDVEDVLFRMDLITTELAFLLEDERTQKHLEQLANRDFSCAVNGVKTHFTLQGLEMNKEGFLHIYLLSSPVEEPKQLELSYVFLMDAFPEQQNKLTYMQFGKKWTTVFLKTTRKQVLDVTKNDP